MTKSVLLSGFIAFLAVSVFAENPRRSVTRQLSYAGLPTISYTSDSDGRLTTVNMSGKPIVTYDWSAEPYDVPVVFFNRWSIDVSVLPDGSATEQVIDAHGTPKATGTVLPNAHEFARPTALLDALAADLGLSPGWESGIMRVAPTEVELRANGKSLDIQYHKISEGVSVGESGGKAIFWDIDLPLGVSGRLTRVLPARLVITSAGTAHLASVGIVGGITGISTADPSGERVTFTKLLETVGASADSAIHSMSAGVHAEMMWQCGSTEHWYCDSSGGSGYCYNYYTPTYCDTNDGGGYTPPPGDTGGGGPTTPPPTPQQTQQQVYVDKGCGEIPPASSFLDETGYNNSGLANYFSFAAYKSPNAAYVLVDPRLVSGLAAMQSELDTVRLPGLSGFQDGEGYRLPGDNSNTCGVHCYGRAVDLDIHQNGVHDCHFWNLLAGAATSAGGYVESAKETVAGSPTGTLDHFHVRFDGGGTNPNYGDGCNPNP